jgi:threonine/homoserine/homoserine lactone efflux protein
VIAFACVILLGAMSLGPGFAVVVRRAVVSGRAAASPPRPASPRAPQFLPARPGPSDTVALTVVAVVVTLAWFTTLALLISSLRRLFARLRVRRVIDRISGLALLGCGARLVLR